MGGRRIDVHDTAFQAPVRIPTHVGAPGDRNHSVLMPLHSPIRLFALVEQGRFDSDQR
jgi:hypothetical protein